MKRLELFRKTVKNERNIILSLVVLILIGLVCWLFLKKTEEFGLNFFTEMLGVAITVFIVDRLIKKRDETRNVPQKLAAYEDVRLYVSRYISFWTDTYRQSVPDEKPNTIYDFFTQDTISKIFKHLDLDSEVNIKPRRKWGDWLSEKLKEFKDKGDKILDRYSNVLEPEIFKYVHQLTETSSHDFLIQMLWVCKNGKTMSPRIEITPELFHSSIKFKEEDFNAILKLYDWCNAQYEIMSKFDNSIAKVYEYK